MCLHYCYLDKPDHTIRNMEDQLRKRTSQAKDDIIKRQEVLHRLVLQQKISLSYKERLLLRLEELSNELVITRQVTQHHLEKWDQELTKVTDDLASASCKSTQSTFQMRICIR